MNQLGCSKSPVCELGVSPCWLKVQVTLLDTNRIPDVADFQCTKATSYMNTDDQFEDCQMVRKIGLCTLTFVTIKLGQVRCHIRWGDTCRESVDYFTTLRVSNDSFWVLCIPDMF